MRTITTEQEFKALLMGWASDPNFATFHIVFYEGSFTSGHILGWGYRHINFEQSVEDSFEIVVEGVQGYYESQAVYSGYLQEALLREDHPMHANYWRANRGSGIKALFRDDESEPPMEVTVEITPLYV